MLEEIFTTQGRLNRLPYVKYALGMLIISLLLNSILAFVFTVLTGNAEGILFNILAVVVMLPFSVGQFMVAIRRLHDLNRSGWLVLLELIPFINVILEIYLVFFRGTRGQNQYGADPLEF